MPEKMTFFSLHICRKKFSLMMFKTHGFIVICVNESISIHLLNVAIFFLYCRYKEIISKTKFEVFNLLD